MAKFEDYRGSKPFFINPYNFIGVDFDKTPTRSEARIHKGERSGVIDCELITKTPISIPDVANADLSASHKEYSFMRTAEGIPMIPGSSIRGPVRSMYEALTNSCLSTVDEAESITFRTKEAFKPGLLYVDDAGKFHLYKAVRYVFAVDGGEYRPYKSEKQLFSIRAEKLMDYSYGETVYVSAVKSGDNDKKFKTSKGFPTDSIFIRSMSKVKKEGMKIGYICVGEPFARRKHFESVFVLTQGKSEVIMPNDDRGASILEKSVKDLNEIIKIYNDEKINGNAKTKRFYKDRNYAVIKKGNYYPIWYKTHGKNGNVENLHLSVANLGRSAYNKNMGDMLSAYASCKDRSCVCPACNLFGMTGRESNGSRVRFTDAIMDEAMPQSNKVLLKELSTPKPSYLPFYLRNTSGCYDRDISYDNNAYVLRGRKFYWHNIRREAYIDKTGKAGERNSSVELVKENNTFKFMVYYDNLSDEELGKLIWTLTLGENNIDGKQCYKIGHGKSIGLGSAKIVVKSLRDRRYENCEYSVRRIDNPDMAGSVFVDKNIVGQVMEITKLDACVYPVEYPGIVDNDGRRYADGSNNHASHQWFTANFSLGRKPERMLPDIGKENDPGSALVWKTDVDSKQDVAYSIGESCEGKIMGYNKKMTTAFVELDDRTKAQLFFKNIPGAAYGEIDKVLKKGDKVKVSYAGKDSNGYDQWNFVK